MAAPFEEKPVVLGGLQGAVALNRLDQGSLGALSKPLVLMDGEDMLPRGRNRLAAVSLKTPSGRVVDAVLKQFNLRGVDRLKTLILPSKARKAWRGAKTLVEKGIPTPFPLAYLERKKAGLISEGYFLAEKISNAREARDLFRSLQGKDLEALLRTLAVFLREAHDKGVLHKDLSDGNVLAGSDGRGGTILYLLDTNRVRVRKKIGPLRAAGNLVRLGVPRSAQPAFLSYYWGGRSVPPLFALWYRLRKKWYTGLVALKKRLGLKKLVRKLGLQ